MRVFLLAIFVIAAASGIDAAARTQYVAVALHDVVDHEGQGTQDAVTSATLVAFFEWMRGNGWNAITLDDIERARAGTRPLPPHAILITVDDGFRSLYTRIYPLLLAYRIPAVASLVDSWMDDPDYAAAGPLITWDEAREMAHSGLVEFASHSQDLHRTHIANPLGGQLPAGATLAYDSEGDYEVEAEYRQRIRADLENARARLRKELGKVPRALAWPYGRFSRPAEEEALATGFQFLLTLDPEPGFPDNLPVVPRLLPSRDADLRSMVMELSGARPPVIRLLRLRPELLTPGDPVSFEKALGVAVERVKILGATHLVVDAAARGPGGRVDAVWFPNRVLPVRADVLSRIVWQMHTRAHVEVAVSLPVSAVRAAAGSDAAVIRLFEDLGISVLADALFVEDAPALAAIPLAPSDGILRWDVRRRRDSFDVSSLPSSDALALRAFHAFERARPAPRLFLLTPSAGSAPSAVADLTLVEAPLAEEPFKRLVHRMAEAGWMEPSRRLSWGVWIRSDRPPSASALSEDVRAFQRRGGVAFGWEQDNPVADEPEAAQAAAAVSAARLPVRF
jgi:peptidoglycan/xylan/chitin deacetylase (PgdA/CDA1 family)